MRPADGHDSCLGFGAHRWEMRWGLASRVTVAIAFSLTRLLDQALPALCQFPVPGSAEGHPLSELQLCSHLVGLASASPVRWHSQPSKLAAPTPVASCPVMQLLATSPANSVDLETSRPHQTCAPGCRVTCAGSLAGMAQQTPGHR